MSGAVHNTNRQLEIERKFLIRYPNEQELERIQGCVIWDIEQTYLMDGSDGCTRRVRKLALQGEDRYYYTQKRRISSISSDELEFEVDLKAYQELLAELNPALQTIRKRRFRIPFEGQMLEIDCYEFWSDRATLEIEMHSETQQYYLPPWLKVIREVSGERAYRNRNLAEHIPMERLP